MTLFETLIDQRVGPSRSASVTRDGDGPLVVRFAEGGVALEGFLEIGPDGLVIEDLDDEVVTPLFALSMRLHRIHDYLARFPASVQRGDERLTLSLAPPAASPLWSEDGLRATVVRTVHHGEKVIDIMEVDALVLTSAALDAQDWQARIDAFDARRAAWIDSLRRRLPRRSLLREGGAARARAGRRMGRVRRGDRARSRGAR
ncbi:MAG: hypothetical protein QM820_40910 [Minicystis sp.]